MDMDAFYQSALSLDGIVGHASYLLLIVSMLMTRMAWLRILAVASGLLSIAYSLLIADYVSATWDVVFVLVNLAQLCLHAYRNRTSRFTAEERLFREAVVPLLDAAMARKLLDLGQWREAADQALLIEHGQLASHLLFIASGQVCVRVNDTVVGTLGSGALTGEISVLTNMPATATVSAAGPVRYLAFERVALQKLMRQEVDIEHAIDQCFRTGMRQKLAAANQALADAGLRLPVGT